MGHPLWLRVFNAVEGTVGPKVEQFVHGDAFATSLVIVNRVKGTVSGVVEGPTRRLWHVLNLPAGSDVKMLRGQLGDLDHEIRQLRSAVESESRKQARHRHDSSTQSHPGPGTSAEEPRP